MKDTPIVILNRDRLTPVKKLVASLKSRNYNNIIVIDNMSTYQPLLNWYTEENLDVYFNTNPEYNNCYALNHLAYEAKNPKFVEIVSTHYAYTDSDVYPIDDTPENFIDDMIFLIDKYNIHKVGMSIKIDDLNLSDPLLKHVYDYEITYWNDEIIDGDFKLYPHPIDTTFSVYAPNTPASWSSNCFRIGLPYTIIHQPFYYTKDNMPEDEIHYLRHQNVNSSNWSKLVKRDLNL